MWTDRDSTGATTQALARVYNDPDDSSNDIIAVLRARLAIPNDSGAEMTNINDLTNTPQQPLAPANTPAQQAEPRPEFQVIIRDDLNYTDNLALPGVEEKIDSYEESAESNQDDQNEVYGPSLSTSEAAAIISLSPSALPTSLPSFPSAESPPTPEGEKMVPIVPKKVAQTPTGAVEIRRKQAKFLPVLTRSSEREEEELNPADRVRGRLFVEETQETSTPSMFLDTVINTTSMLADTVIIHETLELPELSELPEEVENVQPGPSHRPVIPPAMAMSREVSPIPNRTKPVKRGLSLTASSIIDLQNLMWEQGMESGDILEIEDLVNPDNVWTSTFEPEGFVGPFPLCSASRCMGLMAASKKPPNKKVKRSPGKPKSVNKRKQ